MSSAARVIGCRWPRGRSRRPGSVTSIGAPESSASSLRRSSAPRASSRSFSTSPFTRLATSPTRGRSSAGSWPMPRRTAESSPFLPRNRTRSSSSPFSSGARAIASRAPSASASSCARRSATPPSSGPGDLDDGGEVGGQRERELGEDLPVERDAGLLHAGDELRVGGAVLAGGRVDADDPERPEVPALLAAVAGGVVEGALHRLVRALVAVLPAAAETLRELQHAIAT